jgi:hypothetical protein
MSVIFVNDVYLFLSIVWLRFTIQEIKVYKKYRKLIKCLVPYLVNLGSAIWILKVHIINSGNKFIRNSMMALIASTSIT